MVLVSYKLLKEWCVPHRGPCLRGQCTTTRGRPPDYGRHPLVYQRQLSTRLIGASYLESCPRRAPLGWEALWTLT